MQNKFIEFIYVSLEFQISIDNFIFSKIIFFFKSDGHYIYFGKMVWLSAFRWNKIELYHLENGFCFWIHCEGIYGTRNENFYQIIKEKKQTTKKNRTEKYAENNIIL